jgi:hypothetical protein
MPLGVIDTVGGDLPLPIGGGVAVGVPPSDVDVMVEYTPLWLAITEQTPYERASAQYQREQVDQQPEAGEQSLAGWWTRSQMSFHFGAGLDYLDTVHRPVEEDRLRFKTSRNVDVWTPGVVTRLNGTELSQAAAAAERVWLEPTEDGLIAARDSAVEVWDGATWTTRDHGSAFSVRAFCTDGVNYYVATLDGVWTAPIAGSATATKLWDLPSTDVPMCLGWVKQRLMLGHGPDVYELAGGTPPTLPTAKFTHPVDDWAWTVFCDAPNGVLGAGYAGMSSAVFRFELTEQAGAPVLGTGITLISMPLGELVQSALYYMGSLLVLGTTRGARVCAFDSFYGTMSLGPLSVETEAAVTALGGYDRYIWGGTLVGGETSLIRLDLSAPLTTAGHYAWAPDLVFPDEASWTEAPTSIVVRPSGRKAIGVTGRGVVLELDVTDPAEASWVQTARIRMGTVEHKHWRYCEVRGTYSDEAPIGVSIEQPGDGEFRSVHVAEVSDERFLLRARTAEWLALRFDLAEGAELGSYQVNALPGGKRQRLISLPVAITDFQKTRSGIDVGYVGWGRERLNELERLEEAGAPVTVSAPALFPEAVIGVIERMSYVQPLDPGDRGDGTGGVLQLVLRSTA